MVKLDGVDIASAYGLYPDRGFHDQLLQLPKRKPGYEFDWSDENGMETDLTEIPVFERMTYTLPFTLIADNKADYQAKYDALSAVLLSQAGNEMIMDVEDLNRRFKIRYANMGLFEKITKVFHIGRIGVKIVIQFTSDYPNGLFTIGTPSAPFLEEITLNGSDKPVLTWVEGDHGDSAKLGNKIQRRQVGGVFADLITLNGSGVTYTDTTVVSGVSYEYRVATRNTQGYSSYSNTRSLIDIIPEYVPPTAEVSIVGTNILENKNPATTSQIGLNWNVVKNTRNIIDINVGGIEVTPTGNSQSGTTNVNVMGNETPSFSIVVNDGKQEVIDTTPSLLRLNAMYWGRFPTQNLTDADILNLTGAGSGSGKELRNNRLKTFNNINGNGQHLVWAFPSSWGTPSFIVNGFPNNSISKFRDNAFVNSLGYSTTYQVWITNWIWSGNTQVQIT